MRITTLALLGVAAPLGMSAPAAHADHKTYCVGKVEDNVCIIDRYECDLGALKWREHAPVPGGVWGPGWCKSLTEECQRQAVEECEGSFEENVDSD